MKMAGRFMKIPGRDFMKDLSFLTPAPVYIEIGVDTFQALQDNDGLVLPLERLNNGQITGPCRENLAMRLKALVKRDKWQLRPNALCASGVLVRRLALPPAARADWQQLLLLQIEREFPLGPDELAWGCLPLPEAPANGGPARQEFLVAAVRKEVFDDYSSVLANCGVRPIFTLAALARSRFCPQQTGTFSILDLDREHSEWITFENNIPAVLRIFPWGTENFTATDVALDGMVRSIRGQAGRTVFVTGTGDHRQLADKLAQKLGDGIECRRIEAGTGPGQSAAILGLKQWAGANGGMPPLTLRAKQKPIRGAAAITSVTGKFLLSDPLLRERTVLALILLISLLVLPYAQAFLLKPFLAHKIDVIQSQRDRLNTIDREVSFLQYLKENSPPYLDALYLFAKAAPQGTTLDSVNMNERGEVSLSGSFGGSYQQVFDFRNKLIDSGFFSNVTVEEQSPAPSFPPKLSVRITAQWKPAQARALLNIGPTNVAVAQATGPGAPAKGTTPAAHTDKSSN